MVTMTTFLAVGSSLWWTLRLLLLLPSPPLLVGAPWEVDALRCLFPVQNNLASPSLCGPVSSSVCAMCEREENSAVLATEAAVASLSAALSGDAIDAVSSGFLLRASHRAFEKKSKSGGDLSIASLRMMVTNTMKSHARHGAQESVATSGLHTLCGLTNTYKTPAIEAIVSIPDSLTTLSNLLGYHATAQPVLCIRTLSIIREVRLWPLPDMEGQWIAVVCRPPPPLPLPAPFILVFY
jgi:hypothetical protein